MNRHDTIKRFFQPRSIAVIGVSHHPRKLGTRVFSNLIAGGFRGRLFPVHPSLRTLKGRRVYPSVEAIPLRVDLAVIVTPAQTVPDLLAACGRVRIPNVIVISAGFRETGPEGAAREKELIRLAQRYRINLLGPNCLGYLHGPHKINASFAEPLADYGTVTLLSQSGAMAVAITDWARQAGVGFRAVVSMGNKAGLSEVELLRYFGADHATKAILFYLESIEHGSAFCALARRIVRTKPIVVLKAGESDLGRRAIVSHTGALAGDREILAAALSGAGIIQVHRIEDLYDMATMAANGRPMHGNRLAVLTNAGGPGIMVADAVADSSLALASIAPRTQQRLRRILPVAASIANPIDIIGDADTRRYANTLAALGQDPGIDGLLVLLTAQVVTNPKAIAETIIRFTRRYPRLPVVTSFLGGKAVARARRLLREAGIPHFAYPEDAVNALDRMWKSIQERRHFSRHRRTKALRPTSSLRRLLRHPMLLPPYSTAVLRACGIPVVQERLVQNEEAAVRAAKWLGFPVVLKVIAKAALHKTDAGAVLVNLKDAATLRRTVRAASRRFPQRMRATDGEGFLVQPLITFDAELFVGAKRDPSFGPVVVVGLGGIDVELTRRTVTLLAPFDRTVVLDRLRRSVLASWLLHRRGHAPVDLHALADAAVALGRLLESFPSIREIDINPLAVDDRGALRALDSRILSDVE